MRAHHPRQSSNHIILFSEFGGPGADIIRGQDNRQKCRPEIGAGRPEENKALSNICSVCSQARWGTKGFTKIVSMSEQLTKSLEVLVLQQSCFRVVQVTGADYADCNGLYSLTNLSSVWDTKHIVYTRLDTPAHSDKR